LPNQSFLFLERKLILAALIIKKKLYYG